MYKNQNEGPKYRMKFWRKLQQNDGNGSSFTDELLPDAIEVVIDGTTSYR